MEFYENEQIRTEVDYGNITSVIGECMYLSKMIADLSKREIVDDAMYTKLRQTIFAQIEKLINCNRSKYLHKDFIINPEHLEKLVDWCPFTRLIFTEINPHTDTNF